MKRTGLLLVLFFSVFASGSTRFLLQSETRTDYNGSATNNFITAYTYDAQGNRLLTRVWDGLDSLAAPISKCNYSYSADGRLSQELLLSNTGDTLSMVRYSYANGVQVAVKVLRKDTTVRYCDSMVYNQTGSLMEMRRYTGASAMAYYHRYTYDSTGRKTADSLYEQSGSATFVPTQAVMFTYNGDGTVGAEASWRQSGTASYLISTVKFGYASSQLAWAATYEGDGSTRTLMDSLAYATDNFGNRILEEDFDNTLVKLHKIVYVWHDTQVTGIAVLGAPKKIPQTIAYRDRSIVFNKPFSGSARLFNMTGKSIAGITLDHASRYDLPKDLGKGNYLLSLAQGSTVTGHQITITR